MTKKPPIVSHALTIAELFHDQRYKLASYQREYTWTRAEVRALLVDLYGRFYPQWRRLQHDDSEVDKYEPYYLGSIVFYTEQDPRGETRHLVDGQQRITTLHLLLIYLCRQLEEVGLTDHAGIVRSLIWRRPGHSFTVQIDERTDALKALMRNEKPVLPAEATDSLRNLLKRFSEIGDEFPDALRDEALERFVEWLLYRVCVVGIEAENKTRGWEIFETTNDRGVRLGPMDLLKSHLIGQVATSRQKDLSERWRALMSALAGPDLKAPSEFIRELIIAKYLKDLGEGPRAEVQDAVHEWIRANADELGLQKAADFQTFVSDMILKLGEHYQALRRAVTNYHPDQPWAAVTYLNEHNGIPFYRTAVLASLRPQDEVGDFHEKARLVGSYLDLFFVRRLVNRRAMRPEGLTGEVLDLIGELRGCASVADVRQVLAARTAAIRDDFRGVRKFGFSPDTRSQVRYLLGRMTAFTETGVAKPDRLPAYLDTGSYDVEHIVPGNLAAFQADNPGLEEKDFLRWRNTLGALLLLPKPQNSAIGDLPYPQRRDFYRDQNLLAASLHPATRQHNQLVKQFVKRHELEKLMQSINAPFGVEAIRLRQDLYRRLCELIWDPAQLGLVDSTVPAATAPAEPPPQEAAPAQRRPIVTTPNTDAVRRLISAGQLRAGETIYGRVGKTDYEATIQHNGTVELHGEIFPDITTAANFLREKASRGWDFWKVRRDNGLLSLSRLRRGT